MIANELLVSSKEQILTLAGGKSARLYFDPFYKRWYYNLYDENNEIMYAGIALMPDTAPLKSFTPYYLALVDKMADGLTYEPYNELGSRLGLLEVSE